MKSMKNTLLMAMVAAGCAAVGTAQATVVNIQFAGTGVYSGQAGSFSGHQGAYTADGVAAPTWNVLFETNTSSSGSMSNLLASNSTATTPVATTEAVSFASSGTYSNGTTPNNNLLDGFLVFSGTVTLTGLTDNGKYQLYLYGQNGGFDNNGAKFSISTGTGTPATGSNAIAANPATVSGTFQENANYVIFNAQANATGTLAVNWAAPGVTNSGTTNGGYEGDFNGLQVISSAAAVPEPASVGLMGAGALGLLLLGRKRKTA